MDFGSNDQVAVRRQAAGVAGAGALPPFGDSFGRELIGRIVPPLLAVLSVIAVWWLLYLIYPRLLPSPVSTMHEAVRLVSDGTFFFHMYQSLRRVFVGAGRCHVPQRRCRHLHGYRGDGRAIFSTVGGSRPDHSRSDVGAHRRDALRHQ